MLLVLDSNFQTLHQATIQLRRDATWGKRKRMPSSPTLDTAPVLDDVRLFVHAGKVWISFLQGEAFGWDTQVINPIHIQINSSNNQLMTAEIWASETTTFCCGRNKAVMENRDDNSLDQLLALNWVDPVTVVRVDTTPDIYQINMNTGTSHGTPPPIHEVNHQPSTITARSDSSSKSKKKKSHIHGTNGFMVYLPESNEYLGIAHFHRPVVNQNHKNPYARYGHHYTHAFYTVTATLPYRLSALSPEFVFPQAAAVGGSGASVRKKTNTKDDAEIIQFASGLERLVSDDHDSIVIAYGINDCEAVVVKTSMGQVRKLLRPVPFGTEVVDTMLLLSSLTP
jgi:hypothetical protein